MFDLDPQKLMSAFDKIKENFQMPEINDDLKAKIEGFIKGQGDEFFKFGAVRDLLAEIGNKKPDFSKLFEYLMQIKTKFPEISQQLESLLKPKN